jgi:hypothetical protein
MADWTDEERVKLRQLNAQGLSESKIGKLMGRSKYSINRQRKYLGLPVTQTSVKGVRKVQYVRKRVGKVSLEPLTSLKNDAG